MEEPMSNKCLESWPNKSFKTRQQFLSDVGAPGATGKALHSGFAHFAADYLVPICSICYLFV
eukprot:4012240-Amphidinium_carterae.1